MAKEMLEWMEERLWTLWGGDEILPDVWEQYKIRGSLEPPAQESLGHFSLSDSLGEVTQKMCSLPTCPNTHVLLVM